MTIAVLGGTFDPPHFGHLLVARQVLEHIDDFDEVWLLPNNTNPFKKVAASAKDRLVVTKILEEPGIRVCNKG
jgi:nicotinate-nucleotide adenylyltransferase